MKIYYWENFNIDESFINFIHPHIFIRYNTIFECILHPKIKYKYFDNFYAFTYTYLTEYTEIYKTIYEGK